MLHIELKMTPEVNQRLLDAEGEIWNELDKRKVFKRGKKPEITLPLGYKVSARHPRKVCKSNVKSSHKYGLTELQQTISNYLKDNGASTVKQIEKKTKYRYDSIRKACLVLQSKNLASFIKETAQFDTPIGEPNEKAKPTKLYQVRQYLKNRHVVHIDELKHITVSPIHMLQNLMDDCEAESIGNGSYRWIG